MSTTLDEIESTYTERELDRATPLGHGATCESVSAIASAVSRLWGEYGYRLKQISGGLFQVTASDGSRFYLQADAYGNVSEVIPKERTV